MKTAILISLLLSFTLYVNSQEANPKFDSTLAKTYGADDYGMKMYVMVILKTGSNTSENKAATDSLFMGHMNNINRLVELKKLVVAGPFGKNENNFRGIFILNVSTIDEAKELMQTDPAIKADLLQTELYPWYGSAALPAYLETSDKIWKSKP